MSILRDVLHTFADRVAAHSQEERDAMHETIDAIPDYVEQLVDEQLDAEQPPADPAPAAEPVDTSKPKA